MASLRSPIAKEVRALGLPWLACLAAMVPPAMLDSPRFLRGIPVPAYFVATAALGALSIGHEYSGRTVSMLLSLPVKRTRLLATKLGVLAAMLFALWVAGYTLIFTDARLPQVGETTASTLPVLCGLFLAPWLTMLCRSAIGGAVFTLAIPGMLLAIGELLGTKLYGQSSVMEAFRLAFVWYGTLVLCVIGAVMSWRLFMRLEAIEGPGQQLRLPHWLYRRHAVTSAASHLTRRHPVWLLVQKELRLQQLPLALAGLFVLGWIVAKWATGLAEDPNYVSALEALTFLYAGLIPLLVGSSASAGERQIGIVEWQTLQPISALKQWAIKVAVVFGISLTLALALPVTLMYFGDLELISRPLSVITREQVLVLLLLTADSLYVSSLCASALWALIVTIPAIVGAATFLQMTWEHVGHATQRIGLQLLTQITPPEGVGGTLRGMDAAVSILNNLGRLLTAGFILLALRHALKNHHSAERTPRRMWTQLIALALFVTAGIICFSMTNAVLMWMNRPQLR